MVHCRRKARKGEEKKKVSPTREKDKDYIIHTARVDKEAPRIEKRKKGKEIRGMERKKNDEKEGSRKEGSAEDLEEEEKKGSKREVDEKRI